jgi:hypothetical protein
VATIDGVVAIILFIVFVSWSFVYFSQVFSSGTSFPMDEAVDSISGYVSSYLTLDSFEVPVSHSASGPQSNAVFYFDYIWPSEGAKNSTKVYNSSGAQLACNITGNRLYWQSDASAGENYFKISFSDKNVTMNCSGGVLGSPVNQTIPWSAVSKTRVSQEKVSDMTGTSYASFKNSLGIDRDFRVEVNISDAVTVYGLPLPNASSVYAKTTRHATEGGQQAELTVLVW